ncbi:MAG: response regulator [Candidatus Omnitrophica bacterium]|nr:response regulator [Candidatus Omnitrophota bacterium]MBU1524688.1 response regulator [Candidatus Omnitrophota bacterium]MBU2436490.1 response regulator [Candidatus Omnitrophota bacterium]
MATSKKRILIVDDEVTLVKMVKMQVEAFGYDTLTAYDGQEALQKAHKEKPDSILLDLMLPKMDGYKVCGLLKADSRYHNIPIIMFTARTQDSDKEMGSECGADAYITKPFESQVLLSKIQELIEKTGT